MNVLCGEPQNYSKIGLDEIKKHTNLTAVRLSQEEFEKEAINYEVLMVRLQLKITEEMMHNKLKAIISPTTGLDHIDAKAADNHDIKIFSLYGETEFLKSITSTAEHTFALMLSLVRNIPSAVESTKSGEWEPSQFRGIQLKNKALGIIGYGRLGQLLAQYAEALGMIIYTYDPNVKYCDYNTCKSLEELLRASDIISIHIPLNEETKGMIGDPEFKLLKKGAFVVNTSRGEVVDELALLKNLRDGHLAGVAVDVVSDECWPYMTEYESKNSNLLITPHIAGAAQEAIAETDCFIINKFLKWMVKQKSIIHGGEL